jgi:O-antigen/teichoic acid export membrane protein
MSIVLFSNVANTLPETHASTLFWSGFVFTAAATAGASSKILYAAHKGYIANIANGIAAITGFLLLIGGLAHVEKKVLFSICALYGPSMIFSVALAAQQINSAWRTRSRPKFGDAIALLRAARWFLLFNTVAAAVLQIDYIIMSQKISELEIVQYYNVAKLFTFSAFFNQAIMMAIWPRFIEQYASGQFEKIQKSIQNLILSGVGLTFLTTVFVVLAAGFLSKLLAPGTSIEFRVTVIIGFGALALVRCLTDPYAIFMQSIGNMKPLIFFAAAQAPIGAILQWILSDYLGIEGILIALVTSFLLTVAWGLPYLSRLSLTKPKNDSAQRN